MPSYKYILLALIFLSLVLLYRWLPNRKIWALFSLTLLFAGAAAFWSFPPPPAPKMTEEERIEIHQQQEIFTLWYDEHKKNITQLDYNWQQYHNILESFKEGAIDLQTAYVRLTQLAEDAKHTRDAVDAHIPPLALSGINYDLCAARPLPRRRNQRTARKSHDSAGKGRIKWELRIRQGRMRSSHFISFSHFSPLRRVRGTGCAACTRASARRASARPCKRPAEGQA